MKKFTKDWRKVSKLLLVYPSMREGIKEEFINFIYTISKTIERTLDLIIIINDNKYINELSPIVEDFKNLSVSYINIEVNDIWIRDYGTYPILNNDKLDLMKAIYDPKYGVNTAIDNNIGMKILNKYSEDNQFLPFKLDGGNIISNEDYILVSDKLFSENTNYSSKEILDYFQKTFDTKLIIIPTEPLDVIGHTDSLCRFIDEKTILLPIYPDEFRVDNRYINEIYLQLRKELPIDYEYIFIPCSLSDEISDENIFSAEWCYLNYFRIEDHLYFPSFDNSQDYEREIERIIKKHNSNLQVHFCKANKLAKDGGLWNCITSVMF